MKRFLLSFLIVLPNILLSQTTIDTAMLSGSWIVENVTDKQSGDLVQGKYGEVGDFLKFNFTNHLISGKKKKKKFQLRVSMKCEIDKNQISLVLPDFFGSPPESVFNIKDLTDSLLILHTKNFNLEKIYLLKKAKNARSKIVLNPITIQKRRFGASMTSYSFNFKAEDFNYLTPNFRPDSEVSTQYTFSGSLSSSVKFPENLPANKYIGPLRLKILIDQSGNVIEVNKENSFHDDVDKEIEKFLKNSKWIMDGIDHDQIEIHFKISYILK